MGQVSTATVEFDPDIKVRLSPGNFNRISKRSGISKIHVSRVLRGLREPSFDVAADIAVAAGVTLECLHLWTLQFRPRRTPLDFDAA